MEITVKNILVVDDDAQMRMSLRHILRREGHHVQEAVNGQQAIDSIEAPDADFDLVLMDIIMPDKEGVETILYLRKRYPDLKIIAMSGGARLFDFDPLRLARDCGANFTLAKPFEPADLRSMLRLCLQTE